MGEYRAPLDDIRFALRHIARLDQLAELPAYSHADPETVHSALDEAARFVGDLVAPLNHPGDRQGSVLTAEGGVRTPDGFREAYRAYVRAGWGGVDFPAEWGGHQMPKAVGLAFEEMLASANMSFSLCPLLTYSGIDALLAHGSEEQRAAYLPRLISGEWSAAMNLTEPQAGSDLGTIAARAVPAGDGTHRITGSKIFITYGEHDLTDNIIHFVLARTPGSPPGTKGISMFIVPKFLPDENGGPGRRNDLKAVSLERKLGIKASPTCVMAYGEDGDGAVGFLLGGEHQGMRNMFTMMNAARISVGLEGLAIAERAYQQAVGYARERKQGKAPGAREESPIVEHPDVRRMLMTMRANIEAMRALLYRTAMHQDLAEHAADGEERRRHGNAVALLTPVVKTWCSDLGVSLASIGLQVHGGMGFVEETGAAQHYRDARIAPIYEGTNGIQAMDLVMRKLPMDGGRFARSYIKEIRGAADGLRTAGMAEAAPLLERAVDGLAEAAEWLTGAEPADRLAGAGPFCQMFGIVAGGAMMAEAAAAAPDRAAKRAAALFYLEQILPGAAAHQPAATAGAAPLFALSPAEL